MSARSVECLRQSFNEDLRRAAQERDGLDPAELVGFALAVAEHCLLHVPPDLRATCHTIMCEEIAALPERWPGGGPLRAGGSPA